MVILIMVMYPAKKGTPFSIVAKLFIYMMFSSLLVVFLHDGVIKYMYDEERESQLSESFMQNVTFDGRNRDAVYGQSYQTISPSPAPIPAPTPATASPPPAQVVVKGVYDIISAVEGGSVTGGRHLIGPPRPTERSNPFAH
jgi:hypothetical protein